MNRQLVVAKYKEDISWVHDTPCSVIIYDKDAQTGRPYWDHVKYVNLPNPKMGREAHTYLTHIVDNYDDLAKVTFFVQGNPLSHYYWWPSIVHSHVLETTPLSNYRPEHILPFCRHDTSFQWNKCPSRLPCWLGIRWSTKWWSDKWPLIFSQPVPQGLVFCSGAQFAVPRWRIRQRPLDYYKFLLWHVSKEEHESIIDAWILECFWLYIFGDAYRHGFPDRLLKLPKKIMA